MLAFPGSGSHSRICQLRGWGSGAEQGGVRGVPGGLRIWGSLVGSPLPLDPLSPGPFLGPLPSWDRGSGPWLACVGAELGRLLPLPVWGLPLTHQHPAASGRPWPGNPRVYKCVNERGPASLRGRPMAPQHRNEG